MLCGRDESLRLHLPHLYILKMWDDFPGLLANRITTSQTPKKGQQYATTYQQNEWNDVNLLVLRYRLAQHRCGDSCLLSFLIPPLKDKPAGKVRVNLRGNVTTPVKSDSRVTAHNFPVPQLLAEVDNGSPRSNSPPFAGVNAAGAPFADSWLVVALEPNEAACSTLSDGDCNLTDALAILIQSKQRTSASAQRSAVDWQSEWNKCADLRTRMPTLLLVVSDDRTDTQHKGTDKHVLYLNFAASGGQLPFALGAQLTILRKRSLNAANT